MITTQITVSEDKVKRALGEMAGKSGTVISRAANRAATTANKVIKQEVAKVYDVNQKAVKGIFKMTNATRTRPTAVLKYESGFDNLYRWGSRGRSVVSPKRPVASSGPYDADPEVYSAHVMRGEGNKPLDGNPKPFVQITKKGTLGLFQRTKKNSRSPLRGVAGPALAQAVKNEKVIERMEREAGSEFMTRLQHEFDYLLKK